MFQRNFHGFTVSQFYQSIQRNQELMWEHTSDGFCPDPSASMGAIMPFRPSNRSPTTSRNRDCIKRFKSNCTTSRITDWKTRRFGDVGAWWNGKVAAGAELYPRISTGLYSCILDRSWIQKVDRARLYPNLRFLYRCIQATG